MKNKLLSLILLTLSFLIFPIQLCSQMPLKYTFNNRSISDAMENDQDRSSTNHFLKHSNAGSKSLDNLPFQVGFVYGSAVKVNGENYFHYGYWVYANVNLYHKRLFITTEYGGLKMNKDLDGTATYLSLGCSVIPFVFKQHSIGIYLGLSYYSYNKIGMIFPTAELSYLYRLNRYISVKGGIKLPSIQKPRESKYYHNPMVTLGLQLF